VGKILMGSTVLDPENGGFHTVTDKKILR